MKTAYVDTNIFDYVILKNEKYGKACKTILEGIGTKFDAICSIQVPVELLGSTSTVNPMLAYDGLLGFFSFNLRVIGISEKLLFNAATIAKETGISGYDAIHVATMVQEGIKTIITENYKDFKKIKNIEIIRPSTYEAWVASATNSPA
jgi:predicted nucleic acid-binding protein